MDTVFVTSAAKSLQGNICAQLFVSVCRILSNEKATRGPLGSEAIHKGGWSRKTPCL
jgi:hypothetical protein